ncbi:MAG TPA: hypothetical protein DCM08_13580 [Microscillaceae bacterium]|nr:hypothetical protein [Microscillaceae bacterium]
MRQFPLALCLLGVLWACQSADKKPADIIHKDRMVDILTELHLAEARAAGARMRSPDSTQVLFLKMQDFVLKKYGFTKAQYYKSYEYYMTAMVEMDEIYAKVERRLDSMDKATPLTAQPLLQDKEMIALWTKAIKALPEYQGDELMFFEGGRVGSKSAPIQQSIDQIYNIQANFQTAQAEAANLNQPEVAIVYKMAVTYYLTQQQAAAAANNK